MKKYFVVFFICVSFYGYGQKKDAIIYISNGQHYELSAFPKKELESSIIQYYLIADQIGFNKYDFKSKAEAKFAGVSKKYGWTGISFSINNESTKIYYYPVSKNFMENGFSEIYQELKGAKRVKLYFSLYKTDSTPIVIINDIKVME